MSGNYRAKLSSGRIVWAKATGKLIEVFGLTTAEVNDQFQVTFLETFWEPNQMFRQLVEGGLEFSGGESVEGEQLDAIVLDVEEHDGGPRAAGATSCPVPH